MRILVTGSRHWEDARIIHVLLDGFDWYDQADTVVLDGGAPGADHIARTWRDGTGPGAVGHEPYDAEWPPDGSPRWMFAKAGHERNQRMVDAKPDLLVAFKDGFDPLLRRGGTEDCVKRAKWAGLPGYLISHI